MHVSRNLKRQESDIFPMVKVTIVSAVMIVALSLSGCSSGYPESVEVPSPSPQSIPSDSNSSEEVEEIDDSLNSEAPPARYLEILDEISVGNNDSRFSRLATLLESGFLTLEEVDNLYSLVEQGYTEDLAYQLYLYEISDKN